MKLKLLLSLLLAQYAILSLVNAGLFSGSKKSTRDKLLQTNDILHANNHQQQEHEAPIISPLSTSLSLLSTAANSGLSPIILLPGDGGSRLQAKLDRQDVLHHYCIRKSNDWFDLWLNLSLLVPFALECWVDK